jgi:hypothetical protein
MPFKVSDESVNSYGVRILSTGGDFSQFEKNPLMLYDHDDYKRLPIGIWENLTVLKNNDITADPVFDVDDEFALAIKKKVDKNYIKMASLGIIPLEWSDDPEMMLPGQVGVTVTKWILREISITPFGSNKNAFKLYDKLGNIINLSENTTFFKTNKKEEMSDSKDTLRVMLTAGLSLSDKLTDSELIREVLKLNQDNQQLKLKVKTFEENETEQAEAIELSAKEGLITAAVEAKKITLKQKPAYMTMALADLKLAFEGMPVPQNLSDLGGGSKLPKERETWSFSDWTKNDSNGLLNLKESDPEKYKELFKSEYGVEPKNMK